MNAPSPPLELWGGVECTVNRVGDRYFDQLRWSGHADRLDDLSAIAELGIKRLRFPALWERASPKHDEQVDLSWTALRLEELRRLGVEPIVGFVHHGSGPRRTNLLDPRFPDGLAAYAARFANRFPWIERYTPVNEPLTTARFSALYGLWYPHARDERSFLRALLNECKATVQAMRAIRRVNPRALLVQTDDLGRIESTPRLAYQAEFENERRWLGWDLLSGRVDAGHPLWRHLVHHGIARAELEALADAPCPPDLVGVNHYVTSNRFLHEDCGRFPASLVGGNGRDTYVDIEAVRVPGAGDASVAALLHEAWNRYRVPVAVTEAHLGCTRDEQLRWLHDVWRHALDAQSAGVDVRAVTVWALLGSYNWCTMVTTDAGHYEPGAFDVRSGNLRRTALARLAASFGGRPAPELEPILATPGWWRRKERYLECLGAMPAPRTTAQAERGETGILDRSIGAVALGGRHACAWRPLRLEGHAAARPLVICGAGGTLGRAFARQCERRALRHAAFDRTRLDIADAQAVALVLDETRPWAVINAAGYVRVDDAERDCVRCYRENRDGPALVAAACAQRGIPLLTFSSDLVFDGAKNAPYVESDRVSPLNVYGASKAEAEQSVLSAHPAALVVRTSAFFGPWDEYNFLTLTLAALANGREPSALDDVTISPTYVPDLVDACLDLLIDREHGIWHLASRGSTSWADFACEAARFAGVSAAGLRRITLQALAPIARRPSYSALSSMRGVLLPELNDALGRYFTERKRAAGRAADH